MVNNIEQAILNVSLDENELMNTDVKKEDTIKPLSP